MAVLDACCLQHKSAKTVEPSPPLLDHRPKASPSRSSSSSQPGIPANIVTADLRLHVRNGLMDVLRISRRIFLADEELGKKDDDHHRKTAHFRRPSSTFWRLPRRRRAFVLIIGIVLCYLLFTAISSLNPSYDEPLESTRTVRPSYPVHNAILRPKGPPPLPDKRQERRDHYFNGPIKFYSLAKSLYSIRGFVGYNRENKIVLFAVANLKCLSNLLPLACEMSRQKLNRVHIALLGRDGISIERIQEVNGYNESDCSLVWHDARPDYGHWSTDARMEASVKSAIGHVNAILHPQVIITHESRDEPFLVKGVKARASLAGITNIGLKGRASNFNWVTKLDARALAVWNRIQIEILVHAPPASSGSLLRLLKGLHKADYFGSVPGLTIELPSEVDNPLLEFLSGFTWPPLTENRQFTLRRRISHNVSPEEAAMRSIDAFYPRDPWFSHVLVLSPQTELAPSFYHFLKYSLLKYRYSTVNTPTTYHFLGISLELPSFKPTDGSKFSFPNAKTVSAPGSKSTLPVFLWQAPNSNAALYFGDKWIEFHSFLSNRFAPPLKMKQTTRLKSVLKKYASWMEYMLEFIQARGYYILYPAFATEDDYSLATVHNELFRLPEEHESTTTKKQRAEPSLEKIHDPQQTLLDETFQDSEPDSVERIVSVSSSISDLLDAFPAQLPQLESLNILSPSGIEGGLPSLLSSTEKYVRSFKAEIGGCNSEDEPPDFVPMSANDLFCLDRNDS
ncbi:conserved hypothetical protein [Uncinocarpus reesii 1704]|uniref:Glycosyltransferase 2 n=1 Tax=Uncinocarpus reesii (strain UAMH 1704) TaxID=336963 RepID=C4JRY4_UNCRE|nr:uncharacterized protein UREG_05223 [Uncinocarpus reesii 1704]EEP80381.1 conserved hypothetical protein [Uncinocarpus reesii 1704]